MTPGILERWTSIAGFPSNPSLFFFKSRSLSCSKPPGKSLNGYWRWCITCSTDTRALLPPRDSAGSIFSNETKNAIKMETYSRGPSKKNGRRIKRISGGLASVHFAGFVILCRAKRRDSKRRRKRLTAYCTVDDNLSLSPIVRFI